MIFDDSLRAAPFALLYSRKRYAIFYMPEKHDRRLEDPPVQEYE
jgi:hypothetical protein